VGGDALELCGIEGEQGVGFYRRAPAGPDIAHRRAGAGEDDGILHTRAARARQGIKLDTGEVGRLAGLDGADLGGEPERGGAP